MNISFHIQCINTHVLITIEISVQMNYMANLSKEFYEKEDNKPFAADIKAMFGSLFADME